MKKNIMVNFPKQKRFATSKSNQGSKRLIERLAKKSAELAKSATRSINTKRSSAKANRDRIYLNSKFGPMNIKYER